MLTLLAASVAVLIGSADVRAVLPLATASAAILGILSLGGAPWLVLLVPALVLVYARLGARFTIRAVGAFLVATSVLALPPIVAAVEWLPRTGAFTGDTELANLIEPLDPAQIAGVCLPATSGARRPISPLPTCSSPSPSPSSVAAVGGLAWAWARGAAGAGAFLYGVGALLGAVVLFGLGSPWIGAKALATASPAFVFFALLAVAALAVRGRRVEAAVVAAAVVGGVVWSNVLAYREVWLAPRSRPAYRLLERRRWYEVWERDDGVRVLKHGLGGELDPAGVPRCADVLRLARLRGAARIVASRRPPAVVAPVESFLAPASRDVAVDVELPRSGRWDLRVGGSFVGRVTVAVDGRPIGSARHELQRAGQFVRLGTAPLRRGPRRVVLRYEAGGWRPGSTGVAPFPLGPVVLTPAGAGSLVSVALSDARSLCGRRLDWVEAVA